MVVRRCHCCRCEDHFFFFFLKVLIPRRSHRFFANSVGFLILEAPTSSKRSRFLMWLWSTRRPRLLLGPWIRHTHARTCDEPSHRLPVLLDALPSQRFLIAGRISLRGTRRSDLWCFFSSVPILLDARTLEVQVRNHSSLHLSLRKRGRRRGRGGPPSVGPPQPSLRTSRRSIFERARPPTRSIRRRSTIEATTASSPQIDCPPGCCLPTLFPAKFFMKVSPPHSNRVVEEVLELCL